MANKNKIKLSIVIPTTREKFLYRCLESINAQTIKDIQVIVINDKPGDSSLERKIRELSTIFDFDYIKNKENIGVSATRNIGIDNAKGEYLYYLDDDDYLYDFYNKNNQLENICITMDNDNTDLCIFRLDKIPFQIFDEEFKNIKTVQYLDFIGNFGVYTLRAMGNKIFRTEYLRENNIRFKEGSVAEDDHLFLCQLPYLNPKVSLCDTTVFIYCQHDDERITNSQKYKKDLIIITKEILDKVDKSSLSEDVKLRIRKCMKVRSE